MAKEKKSSRAKLYKECKALLLKAKEEHLNALHADDDLLHAEIRGDDGDIAATLEEQGAAVTRHENNLYILKEIEAALERLEDGTYGICEETDEEIEEKRLLAIPWTRLSIEGAEAREKETRQRRLVG